MKIGSDKEYALKGYTIESLLELAYRLGRNSSSSEIDVEDMLKCAEKVFKETSAYELVEAWVTQN